MLALETPVYPERPRELRQNDPGRWDEGTIHATRSGLVDRRREI
jgi:hypothetical protein